MRVVRFYAPQDVRVEDAPEPTAGPGDLLIRVRNCSICGTDAKIWRSGHPNLSPPRVLGHEVAGEVVALGEWRGELAGARKWLTGARHYAMARLAAEVGLRLRELCGLGLDDVHFDHGPLGKLHVRAGKGSRGSGPRQRLVPMLGDARPLLLWWVTEVRGEFGDDWRLPRAPLFPSERGGPIGGDSFAAALGEVAGRHLCGPVTHLSPHVLRHACATRLYGEGLGLVAIQQLLGHRWLQTTMRYVHVAAETIETDYQQAAERAATRFKEC